MIEQLLAWYDQYSYLVLFGGLFLEYVFLPFPGEFVMGYSGFLAFEGKMNLYLSYLLAGGGTAIGSTLTYWVGYKVGMPFFERFGHKIFLGPEKVEKTRVWIEKYGGNRAFFFAYFIPGVRHFTGYFAGIVRVPFRTYAAYAWSGSFVWALTYVSIGRLLGAKFEEIQDQITTYILIGIGGLCLIAAIVIFAKRYFEKKRAQQQQAPKNVESQMQVENN